MPNFPRVGSGLPLAGQIAESAASTSGKAPAQGLVKPNQKANAETRARVVAASGAATTCLAGPMHDDRAAVVDRLTRALAPDRPGTPPKTPAKKSAKIAPYPNEIIVPLPKKILENLAELYGKANRAHKNTGKVEQESLIFYGDGKALSVRGSETQKRFEISFDSTGMWTLCRTNPQDTIQIVRGDKVFILNDRTPVAEPPFDITEADGDVVPGGLQDGDIICWGYNGSRYANAFEFTHPTVAAADFLAGVTIVNGSTVAEFADKDSIWRSLDHTKHADQEVEQRKIRDSFAHAAKLCKEYPGVPFLAEILIDRSIMEKPKIRAKLERFIEDTVDSLLEEYPNIAGYRVVWAEGEKKQIQFSAQDVSGFEVKEAVLRSEIDELEKYLESGAAQKKHLSPFGKPFDTEKHREAITTPLYTSDDVENVLEMVKDISPAWKAMIERYEELKKQRDSDVWHEEFKIEVENPRDIKPQDKSATSYCQRGSNDRRTELAEGIVLQPARSLFVLIHELTHAVPLNALMPELAALPYQDVEELKGTPDFDTVYRTLLTEAYQDEALSGLAEMILYRDLVKAGVPKEWFQTYESSHYDNALAIYENEGLTGYLRSELYIGRNHRSSYNHNRIIELAFLATMNPGILAGPGVTAVMQDHGVSAAGDPTGLVTQMDQIENLLINPTPDALAAFVAQIAATGGGFSLTLDINTIFENAKEHHELVTGQRKKASASFLGDADFVKSEVAILAQVRTRFETYRSEFESAWQACRGDVQKFKWDNSDQYGFVTFYQTLIQLEMIAQNEDLAALTELKSRVRDVFINYFGFPEELLDAEEARLNGRVSEVQILLDKACAKIKIIRSSFRPEIVGDWSQIKYQEQEKEFQKNKKHFYTRVANPLVRLITEILNDDKLTLDTTEVARSCGTMISKETKADASKPRLDPQIESNFVLALRNIGYDDEQRSMSLPTFTAQQIIAYQGKLTSEIYTDNDAEDFADILLHHLNGKESLIQSSVDLGTTIQYQNNLHNVRQGKTIKHKLDKDELDEFTAKLNEHELAHVLFFSELDDSIIPDGIEVVTVPHTTHHKRGIVVDFSMSSLLKFHLDLEQWEHGHFSESGYTGLAKLISNTNLVLLDMSVLSETKKDQSSDLAKIYLPPSTVWVAARLIKRALRVALLYGETDLAAEYANNATESFETLAQDADNPQTQKMAAECARDFEFFARELSLYRKDNPNHTQELDSLADEYATAVKLRRGGFSPLRMLELVRDVATGIEHRPALIKILNTAATQIASFSPQTPEFRHGVTGFITATHAANLTHAQKQELLMALLDQTLPDPNAKVRTGELTFSQRLALFEWFDATMLAEKMLGTLALYPGAEKILFERSAKLLDEIGSAALPLDMQARLLAVSLRVMTFFKREHAAVVDPENTEKLAKVSREPGYQMDLATLVPSRRVVSDDTLPVDQWSPVVVRRSASVDAQTWSRVATALDASVTPASAAVYRAYTLREIEKTALPTFTMEKAKDTYASLVTRTREMKSSRLKLSAALSAHTQMLSLLNDQEKMQLEGLITLPSVAYVLKRAEADFSHGHELSHDNTLLMNELLTAPTISDARRKRELFVLILSDTRYPLSIRRLAARGLGHASHKNQTLEAFSIAYERDADHHNEELLYAMIVSYWQRVGQLPDDHGTLLLDENKNDAEQFWLDFDRVVHTDPSPPVTSARELELLALRYGQHGAIFIAEAEKFVSLIDPRTLNLVFFDDLKAVLPWDLADRSLLKPWFDTIRTRQVERAEREKLVSLDLPPAFIKLPKVAQFLLLRFLEKLPQDQIPSLLRDMRALNANASDAEVFCYFFERTGLIKLGQKLATLVGIVPTKDRDVFARLQDNTESSSFGEVVRTIESEFKKPLYEIFSSFDPTPISSASMGEVYQATLKENDTLVYVKAGPESKMRQNKNASDILLAVAKDYHDAVLAGRFSLAVNIESLLTRFARELKLQMDFMRDVANAKEFKHNGFTTITFVEGLVSRRVLVMIPNPGVKLRSQTIEDKTQRKKAADKFARDILTMVFKNLHYHKDPHPGNELWDEATETLSWLDWGVVGYTTEIDNQKILALIFALMTNPEAATILGTLQNLTTAASDAKPEELLSALVQIDGSLALGPKLTAALDAAGQNGFVVDPSIMETLSVLITAYGVVQDLDPHHDWLSDFMGLWG